MIDLGPDIACDPHAAGSVCAPDAPAPSGCGDGILTEDEACDDGNRSTDDQECESYLRVFRAPHINNMNANDMPCLDASTGGRGRAQTLQSHCTATSMSRVGRRDLRVEHRAAEPYRSSIRS